MRGKVFMTGAAVGYVLGARAGRARYEQIATTASKVWSSPKVQETVGGLEDKAATTAKSGGQQLLDKATGAAKGGLGAAKDKMTDLRHRGEDSPASGTGEPPGPVIAAYDDAEVIAVTTLDDPVSPGHPAGSNGQI